MARDHGEGGMRGSVRNGRQAVLAAVTGAVTVTEARGPSSEGP
ncbi:hypothetical protein ACFV4I_17335 [Nocardiopsis alba]